MIIEVLVCHPDGTQAMEKREYPDDWYDVEPEPEPEETEEPTAELTDAEMAAAIRGGVDEI